jgi:multisite-specific tRNA:(cytosine-C5)-methyltransferase
LAVQQRLIDDFIPEICRVQWNGEYVEPPEPVSWFPEKLAWSMKTPKQVVRKFPPFARFQKFLVSETGVGNISRQEVVSMIPPLLMDIRPGMTVLDMCAAPGSKSAQLIEMVHAGEEVRIRKVLHDIEREQNRPGSPDGIEVEIDKAEGLVDEDSSDDGRATGLLIANDADYRRAQMLVHQVKRLNSPNLIVTNHDASQFPSIRIPSTGKPKYLKFDRILADVPCSGDGTTRKNYNVWKDWTPGNALGLHPLQVRILVRALQMLKVGGRAVYSTCSLNPVENEAVVASAIEACGGPERVRVVNCSDKLTGLKRTTGLTSWKIMDKHGKSWSSWEDVQEASNTADPYRNFLSKITEGMLPRPEERREGIDLENCMRIYPHFQDTGGFFITVLEKLSEIKAIQSQGATTNADEKQPAKEGSTLPVVRSAIAEVNGSVDHDGEESKKRKTPELDDQENEERPSKTLKTDTEDADASTITAMEIPEPQPSETTIPEAKTPTSSITITAGNAVMPTGKNRKNQPQEEFYKYLESTHPILQDIFTFYSISPRFPQDRYMVRNATGDPVKAIYYTSVLVRDILTQNEGRGIKFIQAGVKMFMKQDAQGQDICRWRIQSEGMPILEPWVSEDRVIKLYKKSTMKKLLKEMFIKVANEAHEELGEIGERIRDIGMGCALLRVESSDDPDGFR